MKTRIPDGSGGWQDVEVDDASVHRGSMANKERQSAASSKQFISEAGDLTERLAKLANLICKEHGLTPEHAAFAVALLCCNVRNDFPQANGGPDKFDAVAVSAQDYYDEHAPKVKQP